MIIRNSVERTGRILATEKIIKRLNPSSVLEIGAGDYSFDYLIPSLNNSVNWKKIDFDLPCDILLDINKESLQLPLDDSSFDLIIITEVLEHLLWPQAVLKESYRVLNERGTLLASVPNIVSLSYRIKWLLGGIPSCASCGNMPPEIGLTVYQKNNSLIAGHVIDFNRKIVEQLIKYCGFSTIKFHKTGLYWGRQLLPAYLTPVTLGSNLLFTVRK